MCGIIGYVGSRASKDLLITGLERLEFRGYDSAGIALLEDGGLEYVRAVGNLGNLEAGRRPERLARDDRRRPHALGDARRRERGQRPPAHRLRGRQARDRPERDRRELPRAEGRARGGRPRLHAPRPTPRSSRTCSRPSTTATCVEAVRAVYGRLEGHFTFVVIHHDEPNRLVGVRRETPMVVGLGDGENFLASNLVGVPRRDAPRRSTRATATSSRSRPAASASSAPPTAARSSSRRSGSTGTRRSPSARASRPSC